MGLARLKERDDHGVDVCYGYSLTVLGNPSKWMPI
jgi:hypothetical protein